MKGNNLVILRGNLGSDPTARPVPENLTELESCHTRTLAIRKVYCRTYGLASHNRTRRYIIGARASRGDHPVLGSLRPRTWQQSEEKNEQRFRYVRGKCSV